MTTDHTPPRAAALANEVDVLWNMPWHARLRTLAEALRPGVPSGAGGPPRAGRPDGSVHTWLERVRVSS